MGADAAGATGGARRVRAPGRVNLIGDHTDYTGGLVFPMAIDRSTTIDFHPLEGAIRLTSDAVDGVVEVALPFGADPRSVRPEWGRYVAAMAAELARHDRSRHDRSRHDPGHRDRRRTPIAMGGLQGHVSSDIPAGAGLSSSAALECAIALALGFDGDPVELALAAQRAEHAATGVPTGVMDQLCIAAATAGHALLIDCHTLHLRQVPVPDDLAIVVQFVTHRTLVGSAYSDRVAECARAEEVVGPLRSATVDDVERAALDPVSRRRARHVVTENHRVRAFAAAMAAGDHVEAGRLMTESHRSLRDDFETSTAAVDTAVQRAAVTPGVLGSRMTGGGFGGCIVSIAAPGAAIEGWRVRASDGARSL